MRVISVFVSAGVALMLGLFLFHLWFTPVPIYEQPMLLIQKAMITTMLVTLCGMIFFMLMRGAPK